MPSPPSSLAARVTAQIIELLNNGTRPWTQPWSTATALALPLRHNGVPYRGFNIIALWAAAAERQFTYRHWFSFKQAQAIGARVRRGERATHITFYATQPTEAEGDSAGQAMSAPTKQRAVLRTYTVFNGAQIDNLPPHFYATPLPITDCDDTALTTRFNRVPAFVQHGGARACYNPSTDTIYLPPRHAFVSTGQYFATRLHETAHWSGAPSRLARDLQPRASIAGYAFEELVAELTAAFLGAELHLPVDHLEDHAAYLDHWLKILDRDPGALLTAVGHAQRAADFLRPFLCPDTGTTDAALANTADTRRTT